MEHRVPKREEIFRMIEREKTHEFADAERVLDDRVYSVRDIEALPEGVRAELIDGKMYMMATPTLTHQDILGWLNMRIRLFSERVKAGIYEDFFLDFNEVA